MDISIVIPTRNRKEILKETLSNIIENQNYLYGKFEVIVVNDGKNSISEVAGIAPNIISVINNYEGGACKARNAGADKAIYELLLFIDDDILINNNFLNRIFDLHKKYPNSINTGTWVYKDDFTSELMKTSFGRYKLKYDYTCMGGHSLEKIEDGLYRANTLATFSLSVYKNDFIAVGKFDENFPFAGAEDQEFTERAKKKGFNLIYDKNNVCFHNEKDRFQLKPWLNRQYNGVMGFVYYALKCPHHQKKELFFENTPISTNDPIRLIVKKLIKQIVSIPLFTYLIEKIVEFLEFTNCPDRILFKLYNWLSGIYIYKGFILSYKKLTSKTN